MRISCRTLGTIALCAAPLLQPVHAQARREFAIGGPGAFPCTKYLSASPSDDALFISWVQGFLSGANSYRYLSQRKELLLLPESEEITASVSVFCKKNQTKSVYHASMNLWQSIEAQARK
jgi:hypothetical protein